MYVCFLHLPLDHTVVFSGDAVWIKTSLASVVFILLCQATKQPDSELFCPLIRQSRAAMPPCFNLVRFSRRRAVVEAGALHFHGLVHCFGRLLSRSESTQAGIVGNHVRAQQGLISTLVAGGAVDLLCVTKCTLAIGRQPLVGRVDVSVVHLLSLIHI